jgi:acetyl esterase
MPLDPDVANLLGLLESMRRPKLHELPASKARKGFEELVVGARAPHAVVPVASTEDIAVPGPAGEIRARVYRPERPGPLPTVVFFHGGGWVIGSIETHDNQARSVCRLTESVVVSVDYRLAPEAPFPAAVEDCFAALEWSHANVERLGGDPDVVAVAGDSAGGNLAAVVAQVARDSGGPPIAAQLLVYPAVDATGAMPSIEENARGFYLEREDMEWFRDHYTASPELHLDPRVSPLHNPDLSGLPPAVVVTAEFDPLRDEGEAYARRLAEAGVPVISKRYDGMVHGFFDMGAFAPAAQAAVEQTCSAFRRLLHGVG